MTLWPSYVFLCAVQLSALASEAFRVPLIRVESTREKLIKTGRWTERVAQKVAAHVLLPNNPVEPEKSFDDVMYVGEVGVGSPQKYFRVVMDTGSADFWVPGIECGSGRVECLPLCKSPLMCQVVCDPYCCDRSAKVSKYACDGKRKFNPNTSATYKDANRSVNITYYTGSLSGVVGFDNVCIAGVCVKSQGWTRAISLDPFFVDMPFDGICGLAFTELSEIEMPPPVMSMVNNAMLEKPIFTVWMSRKSVVGEYAGCISFGQFDADHCSKNCHWLDVSGGLWQFRLDSITIEDESKVVDSYSSDHPLTAVTDTGTSVLVIPALAHAAIVDYLNHYVNLKLEDSMFTVPCDKVNQLPNVNFYIEGVKFPLSPINYMINHTRGQCALGIDTHFSRVVWILGNSWTRQYCHVHDVKNRKLGICKSLI